MRKFSKRYQLWQRNSGDYSLTEFDSLEEALIADKYTCEWYVTEAIRFGRADFCNLDETKKKDENV